MTAVDDDPLEAWSRDQAPETLTQRIVDASRMSDRQLGDLLGISRSAVCYWRTTDRESFTPGQIAALAGVLSAQIDELEKLVDELASMVA